MTAPPGELIASGRSADVYDAGPGLVLRRYRPGALHPDLRCEREAELMTLVREQGYPVPRVERANSTDIVMERVEGPTMMQSVSRRPWGLPRYAALLADRNVRPPERARTLALLPGHGHDPDQLNTTADLDPS